MIKILFCFVLTFCLFLNGTRASSYGLECDEGNEQKIHDGNAAFTGRVLYDAFKKNPNKNAVFSSFSVLQSIAQLTLYSKDETLKQLLETLNLPDKFNLRCVFPNLISDLKPTENIDLDFANKLYSTKPLTKDFANDVKRTFAAEVDDLSSNNTQAAVDKINEWVAKESKNRIKDLVSLDMFNHQTRLVLASAVYFQGNLERPFEVKSTKDLPFHLNSNVLIQIPTMYQKNLFKYGEHSGLDCKVLEMPYKGGKYSLVIFLPNKLDGLSNLLQKLQDLHIFNEAYYITENKTVDVYLPRLNIESEFDLIPVLKSVGVKDIFDKQISSFNNIVDSEHEPIYVTDARQKAFAVVDEKGFDSVANASADSSSPVLDNTEVRVFKADHPFAFFIVNRRNIILGGAVVKN